MPRISTGRELELSVVMPCLNERETLEVCIRKVQEYFERQGLAGEVVIADNGSTDGSQEIATRMGARVVNVPIRGYGAALDAGIRSARGRYVIIGDSDDSYDFADLGPFVDKLREGYDLVMGNRFRGGIKPGAMPWKNRYLGNPVLTGIGRVFFACPVGDFHCGLRGLSRQAYPTMELQTTGMEYASEMVIKATLLGLKIAEVPTTLSPDGRSRPPHLRPWRDGWRHLRFMLLFSPSWLFLYPGMALMAIGLCLTVALVPGPIPGPLGVLDVNTLLYSMVMVVAGFQACAFGLFSRVFAVSRGFMPAKRIHRWAVASITLELGLVCGAVLFASGVMGGFIGVYKWGQVAFGQLDARQSLRLAIPSALSICLGMQLALASFFLGVLQLDARRLNTRSKAAEEEQVVEAQLETPVESEPEVGAKDLGN